MKVFNTRATKAMMQHFINSPNVEANFPTRVQQFLDVIDRVSGVLGLNVPQIVDIQKLRSLPGGTFGRAWADFLDKHQLHPLATGPRRKQLHDGIHVLTGYGTDPAGEAEVQAFLLGAKCRPVNMFILLGLLRPVYTQMAREETNQRTVSGLANLWIAYQRGRYSLFDPDDWQPELLWQFPLQQVQALFRL